MYYRLREVVAGFTSEDVRGEEETGRRPHAAKAGLEWFKARAAAGWANAGRTARRYSTPPPSYPRLPAHAHSTYSPHHTPRLPNSDSEI